MISEERWCDGSGVRQGGGEWDILGIDTREYQGLGIKVC